MGQSRPLVSVVTPTWARHELLAETIAHVKQQDYPNIEHVVVSDGPDPGLCRRLWAAGHRPSDAFTDGGSTRLKVIELGRNYSGLWHESFGAAPLTVGMLMARGEYQCWLSDDDRIAPDHLSALVDALEETGADFAYPKTRFYWNGQRPEDGYDIGTDPPAHGQVTTFMYRAATMRLALPAWQGHPVDIGIVSAWMAAGARWAFVPRVTHFHRADRVH